MLEEVGKAERALLCGDMGHTILCTGASDGDSIPPGNYDCIYCDAAVDVQEEESWDMLSKDG